MAAAVPAVLSLHARAAHDALHHTMRAELTLLRSVLLGLVTSSRRSWIDSRVGGPVGRAVVSSFDIPHRA